VKDVQVTNVGISSAIINFTTENAVSAKIYYGVSTDFGGVKEIATSKLETSYTVSLDNLQDGTKYYFKINTFDAEDEEYNGTILDFETLPRPRVSNVKVQQVAKTADATLLVTWESNTEITSIVSFYPEDNPEMVRDVVDIELKEGEHKLLIRDLFPDTTYILTVKGRDVIGNEAVSSTRKVTTSTDTRAPVVSDLCVESSNVTVSEGGSQETTSQLVVTWRTDEPSTSQVEYGEGSGTTYTNLTQEDKNLSTNHVVVISGLTPSKVYHFRAISKDSAENETRSIDTVTITPKATDNAFNLVVTTLQEAFSFLEDV
jgi:phosphodiesterase/alkaline phosphatase D-like protein